MKEKNTISQLMLERYHMGKLTDIERKCIENELIINKALVKRLKVIKQSDEEIKHLYPLENLPRLNEVKDTIITDIINKRPKFEF